MAAGDTFRSGQIPLTGAAQKLTGIASGVQARLKNPNPTNLIYVGYDNTVSSTTGWPLSPAQELPVDVINLSRLWVIGTAADRIAWCTVL